MTTKKIVLTDNEELLAILANSFFSREGFKLLPIKDAERGCALVEADDPALAIFDLAVHGNQAVTCCRRLKADPLLNKTAVVLILPDAADDALADACWEAGCDAVVFPPIAAGRLLDATCALLGINRRLARRFPVSFQLEFAGEDRKSHTAMAVNMNLGGMFLAAETLFPVETRLVITFRLPGFRRILSYPVRVAWVNHPEWRKKNTLPCGMGVEFDELNDVARAALHEFLDSLPIRRT
jgi:CheY-like chemotaxis protein